MLYQCINCQKIWGELLTEFDGYYSHGVCINCLRIKLIPIYRKRQKQEGNFDCFGRSNDHCDQINCAYRKLCLSSL
jgi:hypothetical protein